MDKETAFLIVDIFKNIRQLKVLSAENSAIEKEKINNLNLLINEAINSPSDKIMADKITVACHQANTLFSARTEHIPGLSYLLDNLKTLQSRITG